MHPDVTIRNEWMFNYGSIAQSWRNAQALKLLNRKKLQLKCRMLSGGPEQCVKAEFVQRTGDILFRYNKKNLYFCCCGCVLLPKVLCRLRCLPSWRRLLSGVELTGRALAANLARRPSPLSSQPPSSSSESDSSSLSSSSSSEVSVSEKRFFLKLRDGMWLWRCGCWTKGQITSYCLYGLQTQRLHHRDDELTKEWRSRKPCVTVNSSLGLTLTHCLQKYTLNM